jgi:hypothetical protein
MNVCNSHSDSLKSHFESLTTQFEDMIWKMNELDLKKVDGKEYSQNEDSQKDKLHMLELFLE